MTFCLILCPCTHISKLILDIIPSEKEHVRHDHGCGCEAESGHMGGDLVPVEHDDEREGGDEAARDHLEPDEQPNVRRHLHVEVLLVRVNLTHAVFLHEIG